MGHPVVHFEITARDATKLHSYYSVLFDWQINADNPMNYGVVAREDNLNEDGIGIGGGIAQGPQGYDGHVTFYVQVPDVEAAMAKAESLGGTRMIRGGHGGARDRALQRPRGQRRRRHDGGQLIRLATFQVGELARRAEDRMQRTVNGGSRRP